MGSRVTDQRLVLFSLLRARLAVTCYRPCYVNDKRDASNRCPTTCLYADEGLRGYGWFELVLVTSLKKAMDVCFNLAAGVGGCQGDEEMRRSSAVMRNEQSTLPRRERDQCGGDGTNQSVGVEMLRAGNWG